MAVGDEFGLLAKKRWCTTVPVALPGGGNNTNYRFSRFFVRSVPLFRSLMLTPMLFVKLFVGILSHVVDSCVLVSVMSVYVCQSAQELDADNVDSCVLILSW